MAIIQDNFENDRLGMRPSNWSTMWSTNASARWTVVSSQAGYINHVPNMTGPSTPSGTVTWSSQANANTVGWKAFDGDITSINGRWVSATRSANEWIAYDFGSGQSRTITHYIVYALAANDPSSILHRAPRAWQLQGSNNGSTWTDIDTRTAVQTTTWRFPGEGILFDVQSPGSYRHYRFNVTDRQGGSSDDQFIQVAELRLCTRDPDYVFPDLGGKRLDEDHSGEDDRVLFSSATGSVANGEVLAKFRFSAETQYQNHIHFRAGGSSSNKISYYVAVSRNGGEDRIYLEQWSSGTYYYLTHAVVSYSPGNYYWVRIRYVGRNIQVKFWADGASEPGSPQINYTDNTGTYNPGPGVVALGSYNSAGFRTWDYVSTTTNSEIAPLPSSSSLRQARISGIGGANSSRGAAITGTVPQTSDRGASIFGYTGSTSERGASIQGTVTHFNIRTARITGFTPNPTDDDQRGASTSGYAITNTTRGAITTGYMTSSSIRSAVIDGVATTQYQIQARTRGIDYTSNEVSARITGAIAVMQEIGASIDGIAGDVSERGARIHGVETGPDERLARIHGYDLTTGQINASITGGLPRYKKAQAWRYNPRYFDDQYAYNEPLVTYNDPTKTYSGKSGSSYYGKKAQVWGSTKKTSQSWRSNPEFFTNRHEYDRPVPYDTMETYDGIVPNERIISKKKPTVWRRDHVN